MQIALASCPKCFTASLYWLASKDIINGCIEVPTIYTVKVLLKINFYYNVPPLYEII